MIYKVKFQNWSDGEHYEIVIETTQRPDGTIGAKTTKSLLKTQHLNLGSIESWNESIDMLESMMIVQACHGVNLEEPGYVEGVRCYVTSLRNRLGL